MSPFWCLQFGGGLLIVGKFVDHFYKGKCTIVLVTVVWYKSLTLKKPYLVPKIGRWIGHSVVILLYDITHNMTFYSDPTLRQYTQYGIVQWSYCTHYTQYGIVQWSYCTTIYTIWRCRVILLYDIIHNMTFCSDPNVRHYTQHDILQWFYCTTLYAAWHSTVIPLYYIIPNMTFYSDPTVRHYTQYGVVEWSYCTTLYTIWHSAVIPMYIIRNMTFYSYPTVHYTQYDILQWSYCTTLYAAWHFTVTPLYDIIGNMTFYSDPTVRHYM